MFNYLYFMEFLYFPEDKTEYIPAVIILLIFFAGAVATMYFFIKKSKKDEEKFNQDYLQNASERQNESTDPHH